MTIKSKNLTQEKKTINVALLGLQIQNDNKGCEALTYSFIYELDKIASKVDLMINYKVIGFSDNKFVTISTHPAPIQSIKIQYRSPRFWHTLITIFNSSDLVIDFTGGDSFSDIYGKKRFFMGSLIKLLAIKNAPLFILGPQTYGPFNSKIVKKLAKYIIMKSDYVFARDVISKKVAENISGREIKLTTDVAFNLPYDDSIKSSSNSIKVGINPSGLLWESIYAEQNKFGLKFDYKEYCKSIIKILLDENYTVYLIPHVGNHLSPPGESDYTCCKELGAIDERIIIAENITTPIEAKNIISQMDVFIGARMHATIAAFSSSVATIPFSYSRKFEGLYDGIGYTYLISGQKMSLDEAIDKTIMWVHNYQELLSHSKESMKKIRLSQMSFQKELTSILSELQYNFSKSK
ncbi:polysaccharide pyruvyl transferase family protein [Butyrivibrio sp. MC2013]|uniref:polysaccharide pyruvyl transferase family protein n=1 Tax=Butyrivibrio sp. MC2013 TaxID=1280686 RepID=UPI00040EE92F|nr:polysaccharide pyruvyl transferase family protein [Butyrivibrio sp. MC2013]